MKIKLFAFIRRRPDVPLDVYQDHWRHPHATLAKGISVLRGYVQSHRVPSDIDARTDTFDGVAEAWLDNEADAAYFGEDPMYVKYVRDDEARFADQPNIKFMFTTEDVVMARPDSRSGADYADTLWAPHEQNISVKVIQIVEKGNWRTPDDLDLGRRIGAFRHVCCEPSQAIHGETPPFLGVRELWWPTMTAFKKGWAADGKAREALLGRPASAITLLAQAERVI